MSRWFRFVHNDFPPRRKYWRIARPFKAGQAGYFIKSLPSVEKLEVACDIDDWKITKMLAEASGAASQLQELTLTDDWASNITLETILFFRQIRKLSLPRLNIGNLPITTILHIADLQALQVIHMSLICL